MLFGRIGIFRPRIPGTVRELEVEDHGDTTATANGRSDVRVGSRQREREASWGSVEGLFLFGLMILFLILATPYQSSQLLVAIPDSTACATMNGDNSITIAGGRFRSFLEDVAPKRDVPSVRIIDGKINPLHY